MSLTDGLTTWGRTGLTWGLVGFTWGRTHPWNDDWLCTRAFPMDTTRQPSIHESAVYVEIATMRARGVTGTDTATKETWSSVVCADVGSVRCHGMAGTGAGLAVTRGCVIETESDRA